MACKECGPSASVELDQRKSVAERAMKLALSLPDDFTCRKNFEPHEAEFLSSLRSLAVGFSSAREWSDREARSRYESFAFADAAIAYVARQNNGGGGGESPSCTAKCTTEKETCRQNCDNADGGYFCYFDCRLSYMACLAGCITHGFAGVGGLAIA